MGQVVTRLTPKKKMKVIVLGLESSGKSSIVNTIVGVYRPVSPTIGFQIHRTVKKDAKIKLWDVGGKYIIRQLWHHYCIGNQDLIFVVDCGDREGISTAKDEFYRILGDKDMMNANILIFANKQDLPDAMHPVEVESFFCLANICDHNWIVQPSSAITGDGINEGLAWLITNHE